MSSSDNSCQSDLHYNNINQTKLDEIYKYIKSFDIYNMNQEKLDEICNFIKLYDFPSISTSNVSISLNLISTFLRKVILESVSAYPFSDTNETKQITAITMITTDFNIILNFVST